MSKKTKILDAKATARKFQKILWHYRVRNPDFRNDLKRLQDAHNSEPHTLYGTWSGIQHLLTHITEKWDLPFIPSTAFLNLSPNDIDRVEYLDQVVSEYGLNATSIANSAVSLIRLEYGHFIDLRVRYYDHPVSELLPLIEEELNFATRNVTPKRRRLDKVPFQLKVFDQCARGETFSKIAKKLKRRHSTVKSAFLSARRNIFNDPTSFRKKSVVLLNFDPHSHVPNCSTCRKAEKFEQMCQPARLYANQVTKGKRGLTGYDTSR